jgi:hypothetical protein
MAATLAVMIAMFPGEEVWPTHLLVSLGLGAVAAVVSWRLGRIVGLIVGFFKGVFVGETWGP